MRLKNPFKKLKIRDRFKRVKTVKSGKEEIPKAWLEESSKAPIEVHSRFKPSIKFHIPLLKQANQFIAVIVLIFNAVISQATLTSHSDTQPLFWLFILNGYVALRYLWSSRR